MSYTDRIALTCAKGLRKYDAKPRIKFIMHRYPSGERALTLEVARLVVRKRAAGNHLFRQPSDSVKTYSLEHTSQNRLPMVPLLVVPRRF